MRYSMANGLYLINDAAYLHIQEGAGHFDYTLYDKETMRETYLGRIDASMVLEQPAKGILPAARSAVFKDAGINAIHVKSVPLNMLRKLKDVRRWYCYHQRRHRDRCGRHQCRGHWRRRWILYPI